MQWFITSDCAFALGPLTNSEAVLNTFGTVFIPLKELRIASCGLRIEKRAFLKFEIRNWNSEIPFSRVFNPIAFHLMRHDGRCGYELSSITVSLEPHVHMPRALAFVFCNHRTYCHALFTKPCVQVLVMTHPQIAAARFSEWSAILFPQTKARRRYRLHQRLAFAWLLQKIARLDPGQLAPLTNLPANILQRTRHLQMLVFILWSRAAY